MTGEYDISNCTTLALPLPCSALPYTFFFGKQAAPYRMGGNEVLGLGASLSYSGYPTRCAPDGMFRVAGAQEDASPALSVSVQLATPPGLTAMCIPGWIPEVSFDTPGMTFLPKQMLQFHIKQWRGWTPPSCLWPTASGGGSHTHTKPCKCLVCRFGKVIQCRSHMQDELADIA